MGMFGAIDPFEAMERSRDKEAKIKSDWEYGKAFNRETAILEARYKFLNDHKSDLEMAKLCIKN